MSSNTKNFRPDINGLRAWAVIAVVMFHFGIPGFSGGFIGVDVFFVISGFLMTQIIITGFEQSNFSIWIFYLARARRIIPALLVLCLTLLCLGWFWLPTPDYVQLSKHAFAAIFFISNIKFWMEAGYFDTASHEKWFLHTWSLSVEWQFYIILPIALLLAWKFFGKNGLKLTIFIGLIISLVLSAYMANVDSSADFFLIPTRAWEMLAGGAVWWLTRTLTLSNNVSKVVEFVGLFCIIVSIIFFDASMLWPSYYAVLPVTGAMLVLAAGRQRSIFTSNTVAQRLGTASYSIYLWHWPIVVLLIYTNAISNQKWVVVGLLVSILLGELSLRAIENPARKYLANQTPRRAVFSIGLTSGLVALLAIVLFTTYFPSRLPQQVDIIANESTNRLANREACFAKSGVTSPSCVFGGDNIRVIVLGDSHGDATISAILASLPNKEDGLIDLTYAGCPTISGAMVVPGELDKNIQCKEFNQWLKGKLTTLDRKIPVVIINRGSSFVFGQQIAGSKINKPSIYFSIIYDAPTTEFLEEYKTKLVSTACSIAQQREVFLVRPYPEMLVDVPKTLSRAMSFGMKMPIVSITESEYIKRHSFIWGAQDEAAKKCGVKILNPVPYLCKSGQCLGTYKDRPIYFDDNHLSEYGNKLLIPMFREVFFN
ncbi:acyltransferase [Serratia fonticola]|uniref:acyltransferase family protein n=1 Tax=Serratia fonticola TaxID=47917 RepID=UPI0015C630EF|nr:acyltransferase family protein [Serratia fonticola]MBC3380914.1 acyltransferase [Serratia fonticola]NYA40113.1 acyltransferase [Serratia fonticola]